MILDTIVQQKEEEVSLLKRNGISLPEPYIDKPPDKSRGFKRALLQYKGVSIIAEVKKASPSKGIISPDFDPLKIARNYQAQGAQALSVLTDVNFFQGSLLYLMQVRSIVDLPVLRKDFIIDQVQIDEAHMHGADAILLIAAILDEQQLRDFQQHAAALGMDSLVEVHQEEELSRSLAAGAELIGINNRNLNDFSVDINTTFRLMKLIPPHIPVVSESGLKNSQDIEALEKAGATAALIGETLMRAGEKSALLRSLRPH
jgi:indole-3-glycerol phosphate synthase